MEEFTFDLQRFMDPGFCEYGDRPGGWFYWNTVPSATITGVAGYMLNNWGNNAVVYCGDATLVYNDHQAVGTKIYGDKKGNNINNDANNVVIEAGEGKDTIETAGDVVVSFVTINSGKGDDVINSWPNSSDISINAGADNDFIGNWGSNTTIKAGAGNDTVINDWGAYKVTIDAGIGNDSIRNDYQASHVSINAGKGNDSIYNFGKKVTIIAGDGDDHVGNNNSSVTIKAGTGKDSIYNDSGSVKVYATDDDIGDYFYNEGSEVTITAGAGDDSIDNRYSNAEHQGSSVTIDAGDGKNQISLDGGNNISVKAGANEDIIISNASSGEFHDMTIDAGDDKNLVSLGGGNNISVKAGINEDIIIANASSGKFHDMTIEAGKGQNLVSVGSDWSYVTINGGDDTEGADAVFNSADNALVKGNAGKDYIRNDGDNAVVSGGDDGDIIENYGSNVLIQGDNAKGKSARNVGDYISTDKGSKVTIEAGNNADTIVAFHDVESSIMGGSGNDSICLSRIDAKELDKISNKGLSHIAWFLVDTFTPFPSLEGFLEDEGWKNRESYTSLLMKLGQYLVENKLEKELGEFLSKEVFKPVSAFMSAVSGITDFVKFVSYINTLSKTSTVNGGTGDDTIVSDGFAPRVFEYKNGDGNDEIHQFSVDSTLKSVLNSGNVPLIKENTFLSTIHITKGTVKKITLDNVKIDSSDVMINVGNGSIRLVKGDDKKFKLRESNGTTTTLAYKCDPDKGDTICSIFGGDSDEVIKDTISGAVYRNVLYGGNGNDALVGTVKNDTLYGGDGSDTLVGGEGDDVLYSGGGARNSLVGGDGDDTIYSELTQQNHSSANSGYDTINGGENNDRIVVSGYNHVGNNYETYYANEHVSVNAGSGDDTITNFAAWEVSYATLIGGTGNDSIVNSGSAVSINAGKDKDTIESDGNNVTIIGGKGDDSIITSGDKNLFLYADGDGKDSIKGISANDTLEVTKGLIKSATISGTDVILTIGKGSVKLVDGVNKKFKLREADGTLTTRAYGKDSSGEVVCSLFGSSKGEILIDNVGIKRQSYIIAPGDPTPKDPIIGTVNKNVIYGYGGKDILRANDKNTTLYGGKSNDILTGGDGKDKLYGESGNDKLLSGAGNDYLSGGSGKDTLDGGDNNDTLYGGDGNDSLVGGDGKDKLYGDAGNDTLRGGIDNDTLSGGKDNDKLFGDEGNDSLVGGEGKDTLDGGDNDDTLRGGDGNDSLYGGNGDDKLYGEEGNDTLCGGLFGNDTLDGGAGDDKLYGGIGNSSLVGGDGKDTLDGSGTLRGGDGNDSLVGGEGADKLFGDAGNDSLYGGYGADILNGDKGNDKLWGNRGADTFVYSFGDDKDIIYGFANDDTLTLDTLLFNTSYSKLTGTISLKFNDGGSIKLKEFTATTFHINDDIYQISGSKLVKK